MSFNISSSLKEDIFSEMAKSIRFSLNSSKMSFSSSEKLNFKTLYFGIKLSSIKSPNHKEQKFLNAVKNNARDKI